MPTEAAAPHDTVRAYLGQIGHLALLTREGEIKIAKRIELGEHAVIRAVAGCDVGVREIRLLGDRLRSGSLRVREVVRGADEDGDIHWEEAERTRVLGLIDGVVRLATRRDGAKARRSKPRSTVKGGKTRRASGPAKARKEQD